MKTARTFFFFMVGIGLSLSLIMFSGCAIHQPLTETESFIVPEIAIMIAGPSDQTLLNSRADGLWWTDGTSHHVYVRGWRFREKLVADSY